MQGVCVDEKLDHIICRKLRTNKQKRKATVKETVDLPLKKANFENYIS